MSELIKLCKTEEVEEGTPVAVNPEGFPALAVYQIGGEFFVTGNICTHGNALLTDGFQDDDIIECPFHGGSFRIKTGEVEAFPCQTPIKTYPVTLADGYVCIPADSNQ